MFSKTSYTKEEFIKAVSTSYSVREALQKLNLNPSGANYASFKKKCKSISIDTSHFGCAGHLEYNWSRTRPLEEILVVDSDYSSTSWLKRRLISKNLLRYECYECGISSWRDKQLSLQLDHINGVNTDHRLENLRLLCPNCHSQTPTFAGRNIGSVSDTSKSTPANECQDCKRIISRYSTRCKSCAKKLQQTKITWPPIKDLREMVENNSYLSVAKQLGVSDNAIRKRLRNHE